MGLSRYGAKGREEPQPAQGVRTHAIRKLSSSRELPFFFPRVTQAKFQHWKPFYLQIVAIDKFLLQRVSCAYFGKFTPAWHPITIAILQRGSPAPDMKRILLALSR